MTWMRRISRSPLPANKNMEMIALDIYEIIGSMTGLSGAVLVATHSKYSRYGWILFLISGVMLSLFSIGLNKHWLLLQQLGYMATNVLGLVMDIKTKRGRA